MSANVSIFELIHPDGYVMMITISDIGDQEESVDESSYAD